MQQAKLSRHKIELWTCGHLAGSVCGQCYAELAKEANRLAEENDELRDKIFNACERLIALQERLS